MIDFWNNRYEQIDYAYGTRPNQFLKEQIQKIKPGKLFLPAEGEGRNAVFAAYYGWEVDAFDQSEMGQRKALQLAKNTQVSINYELSDFMSVQPMENNYDVCALIYAHALPEVRKILHKKVIDALKPGGTLILEAFSKDQIQFESGGPKDEKMLYSVEDLKSDFKNLYIEQLEEINTNLDEGLYHIGEASIVRLVAKKM